MAKDYSKLSDEELVVQYQNGEMASAEYLIEKYKNLVKVSARNLFLIGADQDDLIQEGMLGLFKAIKCYRLDRKASFKTFATMCISNQLHTTVTAYQRQKNAPLNDAISLDASTSDEGNSQTPLSEVIASKKDNERNPEEIFVEREWIQSIFEKVNQNLSAMEKKVLALYQEGLGYHEIATLLGKPDKSIDNAIQRIRAKIMALKNS